MNAAELIATSTPTVSFELHPVRAFAYAQQHKLTALVACGEQHFVWFDEGAPIWAEVPEATLSLRDALAGMDGVDLITLAVLAGEAASEDELARLLLEESAADPLAIAAARSAQLVARLGWVLALGDDTSFRVYRTPKTAGEFEGIPLARVFIIAARQSANVEMVDRYVGRLGDTPLSIRSGADVDACGFSRGELAIAVRLKEAPVTLDDLLDGGAAARDVHGVVFALSMSGNLQRLSDPGLGSHPGMPPPPVSRPAQSLPPAHASMPAHPSLPPESVRGRPFRRGAKRQERVSRPMVRDSPSDPGVSPPPPESGPGHRHMAEGMPLTRTSLRASPSAVHNVRLADDAFQRAQRALGLNDLPSATKHIAKALTFDPKNTSYQALQAFATVDRKSSGEDVKKAIRALDAMVVTEDDNAAAHYYLARLLKRDRLTQDMARTHFTRAAELDPSNVHAAAEAKRKG